MGGKGDTAVTPVSAEFQASEVKFEESTEEKKKSQGFSCLGDMNAEKPDPYLLKLKGPRAEIKDTETDISTESGNIQIDVSVPKSDANYSAPKLKKKAKISGPSCLQGEKPDPYLLKLQGPKVHIDSEKPKAQVDSETPQLAMSTALSTEGKKPKLKTKGPSCLQGEKPDSIVLEIEGPKPDIKTPKAEVSVQAPIGELDVGTNLSTDLEGSESAIVTANKDKTKFKGPSCLQGEKPDPHLKLQGPKAEVALEGPDTSASIRGNEMTADAPSPGVKGKKFKGPSCLRGEKPDPHLLKLQGPKIDGHHELEKDILPVKVPSVEAEAKLSITEPEAQKTKKHKGISCLQGEKPDPHLLKLQGPKADIDTLEPSANLSAKVEMPELSAPRDSSMPTVEGAADTDIVIQPKKSKFKGPSCLQGEKPDPYLLRLQGPKADLGGPEVEPIKGKASVDFTAPELNVLVEKPKLDSIKARNDEAP